MSQSDVSQAHSKGSSMSADISVKTANINTAYSRFARHLPDHPYILSVPNFDLPRKRPHDLALEEARWLRDSPFASNEAHLQYMTLVLRDTSDSCFELRTQLDEEREHRMRENQKNGTSMADLGSATPKLGPAKKKISLAAYKEKKGKSSGTDGKSSLEIDNASPATSKDSANISAAKTNGHHSRQGAPDPIVEELKNTVIVLDDATEHRAQGVKRKSPAPVEQPASLTATPSKKMRPDSRSAQSKSPEHISAHKSSKRPATNHGLPPMLSPGRRSPPDSPMANSQFTTSPSNPHGLPPMLSPTLPADLEKAWRDARKHRARANSDLSSHSPLSDVRSSKHITPLKGEKLTTANQVVIPSHDDQRDLSRSHKTSIPSPDQGQSTMSKKDPNQSLIVKLRYSKKVRKQIAVMSKDASKMSTPKLGPAFDEVRPSKDLKVSSNSHAESHARSKSPSRGIGDTSENVSEITKTSKKRLSETILSEKPSKKVKPSPLPNGVSSHSRARTIEEPPVTPVQDEFEPRKPHHITPKNQSATSKSNPSQVSTPHNLTPLPPQRGHNADRIPRPTNAASSSRPSARTSQLSEFSKSLNKAGRDLKHGAQALSTARMDVSARQKQQAVMMLESNMAYMMAYSFQDEVNRSRGLPESWESTWQTIFPFLDAVASYTKHFPDLEAVRCYLAYAAAHRAKSNMLAYMVAAAPATQDTTTPGASGPEQHMSPPESSHPTAAHALPHNDPSLPAKIASFYRKARAYITEASSKLPPDDIAKRYPRTWAAREQRAAHDPNAAKKERESMLALAATAAAATAASSESAATGGGGGHVLLLRDAAFWLPVTEAVTPIQAVRFGVTLCAEWAKQEGVRHEVGLAKAG